LWRTFPRGATQQVDLKLLAIKTLFVVIVVGAPLIARLVYNSPLVLGGRLESPHANVVLRHPTTWDEAGTTTMSLHIARAGAHVWLQRLAWSDQEVLSRWFPGLGPAVPLDLSNPLPHLASYLRLELDSNTRVVQTRMAGRRANMIVSRYSWDYSRSISQRMNTGWGATVVATGPDLLFMQLYAPSRETLDMVWDDWLRMVRRVRLTNRDPVEPTLGAFPDND
jgi:hypothetical protein